MTSIPNPWIATDPAPDAPDRFVLDERAFLEAIEPEPPFLPPVTAVELVDVLAVLAGH